MVKLQQLPQWMGWFKLQQFYLVHRWHSQMMDNFIILNNSTNDEFDDNDDVTTVISDDQDICMFNTKSDYKLYSCIKLYQSLVNNNVSTNNFSDHGRKLWKNLILTSLVDFDAMPTWLHWFYEAEIIWNIKEDFEFQNVKIVIIF